MKILIVDDKKENRYMLRTLLTAKGYEAVTASNGKEALEKLGSESFGMIISDILMPIMDGFQLCRHCKGDETLQGISFVFYTATYTDERDEELALKLGADKFIRKPVEPDRFVKIIQDVIADMEEGRIAPGKPVQEGSTESLKLYSERLVTKLEKKMLELEKEIAARKKAEEVLRRSNREWEATFNAITDWVCLMDLERRVLRTNEAGEEFLGVPLQEITGHSCCKLVHGRDGPVPGCVFEKMRHTLRRETVELQTPDGDRWVMVTVDPVKDDAGDLAGAVHIVRDITQRKKMEKELIKARNLESLGVLAGGIAHDFNNLLAVILGNVDLSMSYALPESELHENMSEAKKALIQAKDLCNRFLTFSGGGDPIKETGAIVKLIQESTSLSLSGSKVRCEFSLPDDLWPVEFDEGQMNQVIDNLIMNAKEAMPEGGVVKVKAQNVILSEGDVPSLEGGKYIRVSIEDHGAGIPEGLPEKVFDPYFSTKGMGAQKGMGLGLPICHSIINKHGGYIGVESKAGVGAAFYFYLPAAIAPEEHDSGSTGEARPSPLVHRPSPIVPRPAARKGKILVMDDEEMVRRVTGQILMRSGTPWSLQKTVTKPLKSTKRKWNPGSPLMQRSWTSP